MNKRMRVYVSGISLIPPWQHINWGKILDLGGTLEGTSQKSWIAVSQKPLKTKGFCASTLLDATDFIDIMRNHVSKLLAHGVNLKQIQKWLGHGTITATGNIYAHLDVDPKRQFARLF